MNDRLTALKQDFSTPLIANLLEQRCMSLAILGAVGLQTGLTMAGLPGWPCLFRHSLGLPCPGCGLSRAMAALLQGEWDSAFSFHAFAPLILMLIFLVAASMLLPDGPRRRLIAGFAGVERRSGLGALVIAGMLLYWLGRLLFFYDTYLLLMLN
jgi:hypothetical protein